MGDTDAARQLFAVSCAVEAGTVSALELEAWEAAARLYVERVRSRT